MGQYKILSLDGGGVQGLLTVRLLERLTTEVSGLENAFDSIDLIAGNSSGGLIALAMARAHGRKPMAEVLRDIKAVFQSGHDVFGWKVPYVLGGFWLFSRYLTRARRAELTKHLRNTTLSQLGTHVLVTTVDLDNKGRTEDDAHALRRWKPKVFHSFKRSDLGEPKNACGMTDREQLARDVALYTTAAPAYFPTVDGYMDGGMYANNPAMCAVAQVLDRRYEPALKPTLDEIVLLSVGAGKNARFIAGLNRKWGLLRWARHYVNLAMDATVGAADYQCRQILGEENYHRLDVEFRQGVKFNLDDTQPHRLGEILKIADDVALGPHVEWLKRYWLPRPKKVSVPVDATSKHILGTTELTCLMPIRPGFADAFETHTYSTRARMVLRALHLFRQASREFSRVRVFPDIVDFVRSIHSFRLSFVGTKQLLLSVTFDRPWEPYIRLIWRHLGPMIDLILVNCEGYEAHASSKGFEPFVEWVRKHQIEAELFYASSPHTVDDIAYLTKLERLIDQPHGSTFDRAAAAKLRLDSPEEAARTAAHDHPDEMVRQGLIVLAAFYKLREVYRDGTSDAEYLRAAAVRTFELFNIGDVRDDQKHEYGRELEWLEEVRKGPSPEQHERKPDLNQIQAGIITNYQYVTHGCLLLARIEHVQRARDFLADLVKKGIVTRHEGPAYEGVYTNIAFTFQGLKRLGVGEAELAAFPKEFREGMEARAGLLGDVRANHPDNWEWPEWNWETETYSSQQSEFTDAMKRVRVRPATVDFVIQLQLRDSRPPKQVFYDWHDHPLRAAAEKLVRDPRQTGIRVMSVQPMVYHRRNINGKMVVTEHFGFPDGISQPAHPPLPNRQVWPDGVKLGEFVLGYENDRDDPPFFDENDIRALPGRIRNGLLDNGTFLVVRKLEQHVGALNWAVDRFLTEDGKGLSREEVFGKLMGRDREGTPLTDPRRAVGSGRREMHNDFTYDKPDGTTDDGSRCPLHAHIRRGNPRTTPVPRIARRAMSYGPSWEQIPSDNVKRGMLFMAYNASIAEQFEVIQRWMTGGNSTGGFSGRTDPFLRVPQEGRDDFFLIPHNGDVLRLNLGDKPFVSLKWGMYLFVPSMAAIKKLAATQKLDEHADAVRIALGEQLIAALRTDDDWSAMLEDTTAISSGRTAAVCAAIRNRHGGVLRTPGGLVLVAGEPLATKVLLDDRAFSVSEYATRMRESIGKIYLGMDSGDAYTRLSTSPNKAIEAIQEPAAFYLARGVTADLLRRTLANTRQPLRLPLQRVAEDALAELSVYWFGLPDGRYIKQGGRPADGGKDRSLHCPFHFIPPSRYIFSSPRPRDAVRAAGIGYGTALRTAVKKLTHEKVTAGEWPRYLLPIPAAVWEASSKAGPDPEFDLFARMLVGVMEGFLPTVYGNFLKTLHHWLSDDETFWRVQQDLLLQRGRHYVRAVNAVKPSILRAMQERPVPDVIYRTAKQHAQLGDKTIEEGDRVVVLTASVMQQVAQGGSGHDVYPMFGGNRKEDPHPTHACPGYRMGLGVILGMITALLEAGAFARTQTPFLVEFSRARVLARRHVQRTAS